MKDDEIYYKNDTIFARIKSDYPRRYIDRKILFLNVSVLTIGVSQ